MKRILFVCSGNTCRSPLAKELSHHKASDVIEAKSAGLYAAPGVPLSPGSTEVLKERGITSDHTSQPISQELVDWADIVLTMTRSHRNHAKQLYPEMEDKIFTLIEYATKGEEDKDIQDPFGGPVEVYRKTAEEIDAYLQMIIDREKEE